MAAMAMPRRNVEATPLAVAVYQSSTGQEVRPATETDADYVRDAFCEGLAPFYGGDHSKHAQRVLDTHLKGGEDDRGLLSVRQQLLVLWRRNVRLGVLNLVFKRQGTCKISPLILHPRSEEQRGLGSSLIEAARHFAEIAGARQLYCTVTEGNAEALAFFQDHGFIVCGRSHDQYKAGQTEVLLRTPLRGSTTEERDDIISVSQITDDRTWKPARRLLESKAEVTHGIRPDWAARLLDGSGHFRSSDGPDALAFVALDNRERCRGAAVVTAKKGGALKVMPMAATGIRGFYALVVDLPLRLAGLGLKAYLHLTPSAEQVVALQDAGWICDANMPHAYREGSLTQQWSYQLNDANQTKTLRVHNRYLSMIASGEKTLEIRVAYPHMTRITTGDALRLTSQSQSVICDVSDVRCYPSFDQMLEKEDVEAALPGLDPATALDQLRQIYPAEKERLGVLVLELANCRRT